MVARRALLCVSLFLGIGMFLSACASSGGSVEQSASPKSACSLLSTQEASEALGAPVQTSSECTTYAGNQSGGLYHPSDGPGTLLVHVSWDKQTVTTFTVAHSGHAKYLNGEAPPQYLKVTVAGVPAYWQVSPVPGPGNAQGISSLKSGYVVTLTSMSLSQSQVQGALAVILNHL